MAKKAKPEKSVVSTMRLPADLWKRINAVADKKRVSMNWAVVQAVEEFVEREERKQ